MPRGYPAELRTKPARKQEEAELQKAIWQHWLIRGNPNAIMYAVPNGEHRSKSTGARLKAMGVVAGVSDFAVVMPDGRAGFLELKLVSGSLSRAQLDFQARCHRLGIWHHVAYNVDDALRVLEAWQIIKPETSIGGN